MQLRLVDGSRKNRYDREAVVREPWEDCPPKDRLLAYADKQLQGRLNEWTYRHLKFCGTCLERLKEVRRVPTPDEIISSNSFVARLKDWLGRWFKRSD